MKTVDCRGMVCPQPVLETKKALEKPGREEIRVLVDNPGSRENVRRFAESQGHRVNIREEKGAFAVQIHREGEPPGEKRGEKKEAQLGSDLVVFIDSDSLGRGSEELGKILMRSFMHTLAEADSQPALLIFVNSEVKLTCEGSEVLEDLRTLTARGVAILSCGTCLDYFGLKEKLQAGRISNMYEILNSLAQAGKALKV